MKQAADRLRETASVSSAQMEKLTTQDWEVRSAPGKWSRKEILGHLIDSAANNHQRFVRAQYGDKTPIGYDGDKWVSVQRPHEAATENLISLWEAYNLHLAHVIAAIPEEKRSVLFHADGKEPQPLEWLVEDYLMHLDHHLHQILG